MAQSSAPVEPHILAPPIPIRSHLRNGSAYQQRLRAIKFTPTNPKIALSSPVSQTLPEEVDRELTEIQQRPVSAILMDKNMVSKRESLCWESEQEHDTMIQRRRTGETLGDFCFSELGSEVTYCDDHPNQSRSDLSNVRSTASSIYRKYTMGEQSEDLVEQIEVQECVPSLRGSRDGTASATHMNHAISFDNTSPFSDYSIEKMDTKVSDWLARGFLSTGSEEPSFPGHGTSNSDRPFPPRHAGLSLFPPTSPLTGNREYTPPGSPFARPVCPTSPLNNGRDAYGNYIPSDKRDYFTAQSPPTSPITPVVPDSHNPPEQGSLSPMVRLRGGGWGGFKPFWKTSGTEELGQGLGPTSLQTSVDKDGILQDIVPINHDGRPESRAPRSVRSQFSTTRAGKIQRTTEGTLGRPSVVDTRQDYQFSEPRTLRQGSNTSESADTDDSSIHSARTVAVLCQDVRPQLSLPVPISPVTRPLTIREYPITYGRADVPIRDGPRSPPIDKTFAPPNLQSALAAKKESIGYSMSPPHPVVKTRFTSWNTVESRKTQGTDSTLRSHMVSPRDNKMWDRKNPPHPPRLPPPNPPRYLRIESLGDDASESFDDDSYRAPSLLSANTMDDNLIDMLGLEKTDAYRRVEHNRAVQHIQAERQVYKGSDHRHAANVKCQEEVRQQEPDQSTIVPDDSVTAIERQPLDKRYGLERMIVSDEPRPPSSSSPSQYLPRHGRNIAKAKAIPQQRNEQYRTLGYPSIIPASESLDSASCKRQNSLQTVISKAGRLTRFILAAPSDSKYRTYSQRHPPVEKQVKEASGLGADATGWHRTGKFFPSTTQTMLISTQAPDSTTVFRHGQPLYTGGGQKQPDNRSWEHPRGKRAKKVEKVESKRQGWKWTERSNGKTIVQDTKIIDFASGHLRRGGQFLGTLTTNMNTQYTRSRGATRLQHPGFARSGPHARSPSREAPTPLAGPPSVLLNQRLKHTSTPRDSAGTLKTNFVPPDSESECYVRRNNGEVLPPNTSLGYPYHKRLNKCYDADSPDAATLNWIEGICAQTDAVADPIVKIRGDGVLCTDGEASSLASQRRLLTSEAIGLNSGNETIDSSDTGALLISSTHLNLDQVSHEAIASVHRINRDDTRPSLDNANLRSSFSTDSTIELRRKKRAKEDVWRNEDKARAMAMAMHSIG